MYFVVCLFFCLFGCDEPKNIDTTPVIEDALLSGDFVQLSDAEYDGLRDVLINGVTVGTSYKSIQTGCYGIPDCVGLDESNVGLVKISLDDFVYYGEESSPDPPSGVLLFLTRFYSPYWYTNANYHSFRNQAGLKEGDSYHGKRLGWCQGVGNPHCNAPD